MEFGPNTILANNLEKCEPFRSLPMKVMANSIPKGGTHLLLRLLALLGYQQARPRFWIGAGLIRRGNPWLDAWRRMMRGANRNSTVVIGSEVPVEIGAAWLTSRLDRLKDGVSFGAHCLHTSDLARLMADSGVRVVCIIRDPRAIAVSHLHYLKRTRSHFFHRDYVALPDDDARIMLTIRGGPIGDYRMRSLGERYRAFSDWRNDPNAVVVRFEDLVGTRGGGNDQAQADAIAKIAKHLDITITQPTLDKIQSDLFGKSNTFRTGKIDSWREELSEAQINALKDEIGALLIDLRYEQSENWNA